MAPKLRWFLGAILVAVGLDQATKAWARHALRPIFPSVVNVIPSCFDLRYSENPGAAFGLFRGLPGARYLMLPVGIGALVIIINVLYQARPEARRLAVELGLLAGGALGNFIDRLRFGHVTDFVVWRIGIHEWPTFNIADAALVLGVVGLLLDREFARKRADAPDPPQKKSQP
jgi:signal peptidase II